MNTKFLGIGNVQNTSATADAQPRNRVIDTASGVINERAAMPSGDRVSVSDTAMKLRSLHDHLAQQPVVDVARVTSLRHDIMQGTLRMDSERVAEKLLNLERALRG